MDLQTWLATVVGSAATLVPVVALLVWLVKATPLSSRYYPHAAVACGIALAYAVSWMTSFFPAKEAGLIGLIAGGIAAGGFVLGKSAEIQTVTATTTVTSPTSATTVTETATTPTDSAPVAHG